MVKGFILESWIVEDPNYDKSKMYGFNVPPGSWMVSIQIEDKKFWDEEVKELGKYGFSIEGLFGNKLLEYHSHNTCSCHSKTDYDTLIDELTQDELLDIMFSANEPVSMENLVLTLKSHPIEIAN
jgi:hypothetical protein